MLIYCCIQDIFWPAAVHSPQMYLCLLCFAAPCDATLLQTLAAAAAQKAFQEYTPVVSVSKFPLGGDNYLLLTAVLSKVCQE